MSARHTLSSVQFGHEPGDNSGDITAHIGGTEVGRMTYWHTSRGEIGIDDLEVNKEHQRKGIATGMYGHLHQVQPGKTVVHDWENMTDDSKELSDHLIVAYPGKHRMAANLLGELK